MAEKVSGVVASGVPGGRVPQVYPRAVPGHRAAAGPGEEKQEGKGPIVLPVQWFLGCF